MAKDSGTYAELHAWKGPLMRACRAGQIDDVVAILEKQLDDDAEDDNYRLLQDLLYSAARGGQVDMLEWLLDEHPEYPKREYDLTPLHYAIFSDNQNAFQVYKALIRRFPALKEWDLGHMGDPLGVVAVSNDVPFATFLLENGADATRAHYLKFPVRQTVS
ncbi:hypothetical protein BDZ85DRAFT_282800 [Elsinoe ampelina]|uniref:Uncharacterized protein n=1 Tax=Elsinoe ampelina TaxID=302913 RepID=A0A6A6GAQ6_9PEZI|nr:hypothetical protein BDZ85DRAFT_282800 [Elsinoe ampelina]